MVMQAALAVAVAAHPAFLPPLSPPPLGPEADCAMRAVAQRYAAKLLSAAPAHRLRSVEDALQLRSLCNLTTEEVPRAAPQPGVDADCFAEGRPLLFVDAVNGSDTNPGSEGRPVRSIGVGVSLARERGGTVVLRGGTHFVGSTLQLTPDDSGLCVASMPGEYAWISGAVPLSLSWTPYEVSATRNVWVAEVPGDVPDFTGLHDLEADGMRALLPRARFPNRNPHSGGIEEGWVSPGSGTVWERTDAQSAEQVLEGPLVAEAVTREYNSFAYGVGGPCSIYTPSGGYLCSANASGGWYAHDTARGGPYFPTAVRIGNGSAFPNHGRWGDARGAVLHAWTNQWFTSMWEVLGFNQTARRVSFGSGGFQGGRGWHFNADPDDPPDPAAESLCTGDPHDCGPLRVENLLAELDAPEEWYFDAQTRLLYLFHNGTGSPAAARLGAVSLATLVNATAPDAGPSARPDRVIRNVTFSGVGFRDAAPTYMMAHGVPSGGDWALQRSGALLLEGTEGVVIRNCTFTLLEGNAVFLSGYNRRARVEESEFAWIGDSAMAAWGYTASGDARMPPGTGPDGTGGNQPRLTEVTGNLCREVGLHEKQSSCWFQAKTSGTALRGNVFINGPRAMINFNDGFGGANVVESNLLANSCRESADHGAINSWDRQPYVTDVRNGTASAVPAYNWITSNYIFSNYYSWGMDNDDGSSYYDIGGNVIYGGDGLKSDYMGHSKRYHGNLNVGARLCCFEFSFGWDGSQGSPPKGDQWYQRGFPDVCEQNRCVLKDGAASGWSHGAFALLWGCDASINGTCAPDGRETMTVRGNSVYCEANQTTSTVLCGKPGGANATSLDPSAAAAACGPSFAGNTVGKRPQLPTIVSWAEELLGL